MGNDIQWGKKSGKNYDIPYITIFVMAPVKQNNPPKNILVLFARKFI